ncbi:MAG: putative metallopeptidase [Spirochaetes bacterium]|nr:putative metallopeptidase [Spirochaetota bacterium]
MSGSIEMRSTPRSINLSETLHAIIADIVRNFNMFSHIVPEKLHVCTASNRAGSQGATFGKLVPLKFENGKDLMYFNGKYYTMPRIEVNGIHILYVIYFYIPRFTDLPCIDKLRVIFHELYHIHPLFNGDIRRFGEKGRAHGHSKKTFDTNFEMAVHEYMKLVQKTEFDEFLHLTTNQLFTKYARVFSHKLKVPRPIVVQSNELN